MVVVDYAWGRPGVDDLKLAGATGVARYLSWLPNGKVIDAGEYATLRGAGLDVVLVWEYDARDWAAGRVTGEAHAKEAVRQARALGYPQGAGIYGAADWDMTRGQWDGSASAYAGAFSAGIRAAGYRVGVYGPYDVLTWCRDECGYGLFWQAGMSTAWSGGRNAKPWPGVHLRQRRRVDIDGVDCDINDAHQANYGQHEEDDMASFSDREREILVAGCSTILRMARGFDTLDDGKEKNQLFDAIMGVAQRPAAQPAALTGDQVAQLGDQAGTAAAKAAVEHAEPRIAALEAQVAALGEQVAALTAGRRAAALAEGEALAP